MPKPHAVPPNLQISTGTILPAMERALCTKGISPNANRLLAFIVRRSGRKGVMWWENKTIGEKLNLSPTTVSHIITELTRKSLLFSVVTNQTQKGRRYLCPWPTRYNEVVSFLRDLGSSIAASTIVCSGDPTPPVFDPKVSLFPQDRITATPPKIELNTLISEEQDEENRKAREFRVATPTNLIFLHKRNMP